MRTQPFLARVVLLLAATCATFTNAGAQTDPASEGIYIVGALHRLHEQVPGFDYEALRRIMLAIDPQVLLFETRPDELSERMDTPGRPEYPRVVWPYLTGRTVISLPMEPARELFDVWVGEATAGFERLAKEDPKGSNYWSNYQRSLATLLKAHWKSPADAHDAVTADMARSWYLVQYAVGGKGLESGQERWDRYMIDRAREAARQHPHRRILVLASYRNHHRFESALREEQGARVVDMEAWLRRLPSADPAKPSG